MDGEFKTVADFCNGAGRMREAFDAHFHSPDKHSHDHQVWNYWHVPDAYTYLRTPAHRVIPIALVDSFVAILNGWAASLNVYAPTYPWLSLYVNGCGQALHNDAAGGRYGYVFSLTRWDRRNFTGGETIIFPREPYWDTPKSRTPQAGESLYRKIPALFNQLLVFDDRLIHGVAPVQGTMDPLAGRVVLHGHLVPTGQ